MKLLVVGDWHSELHEEVVSKAFKKMGHDVAEFRWHTYFQRPSPSFAAHLIHVVRRVQNKFLVGNLISKVNSDLLQQVRRFQPDVIFVYRGTHVKRETLMAIKEVVKDCILVGYNNDDPFSKYHPAYLWRLFIRSLPAYDLVLAYRQANMPEYRRAGARRVELLRSWFVPERNHPVPMDNGAESRFNADVVFVGHYEDDQRLEFLEEVVRQGFKLRLFGPGYDWDPVLRKSPALRGHVPVHLVWGEDYNRALCGAKIALCFFSKMNRDTYTRRCFEIPASGTFLLSEFSEDLASLYKEGSEVEFFRTRDEMIKKIRTYLKDDEARSQIAQAGAARVRADGHDVESRMSQVLTWVKAIQSENMNETPEG